MYIRWRHSKSEKGGIRTKKKFVQVYQFKISLWGIRPPIWRRIQVPETYTFWDLHLAIQDVMGWADCHLHEFGITSLKNGVKRRIGIPEGDFDEEILPGWKQKISNYFSLENRKADYVYDFGDDWEHIIELEKILPSEEKAKYPICIKGKRACPPEDCGGISGYYNLVEIMKYPNHEKYEEMLEWLGGVFDPEHFHVDDVRFDDPNRACPKNRTRLHR